MRTCDRENRRRARRDAGRVEQLANNFLDLSEQISDPSIVITALVECLAIVAVAQLDPRITPKQYNDARNGLIRIVTRTVDEHAANVQRDFVATLVRTDNAPK